SRKHPNSSKRAEKYINMEENSRLGETSKSGHSYSSRDKDKESKKKEDQHGEKPRKYHNYTPFGCLLWMSTEKYATLRRSHQLAQSKTKEVGRVEGPPHT
ncbi:hypothetical protein DRJ81_15800, partial [Enterococcus faecalis]